MAGGKYSSNQFYTLPLEDVMIGTSSAVNGGQEIFAKLWLMGLTSVHKN